jgi:ribosomal protein L40E
MSYCPKCGAYIPDGDTKCVACGYDTSRPEEKKPEEKTDYSHRYDYGGSAAAQTQTRERREERREQRRERSDYRTDPGFESQQDTGPYASQGGEQRSAPDIDYSDLSPEDDAAVKQKHGNTLLHRPAFHCVAAHPQKFALCPVPCQSGSGAFPGGACRGHVRRHSRSGLARRRRRRSVSFAGGLKRHNERRSRRNEAHTLFRKHKNILIYIRRP